LFPGFPFTLIDLSDPIFNANSCCTASLTDPGRPRYSAAAPAFAAYRRAGIDCRRKLSLKVQGRTHLPAQGPFLLVTNHYTRPGFGVWWTGLALSATLPMELHWIITAGWTGTPLEPLSRWLLRRVAQVYGLTAMPPMPPNPEEEAERAAAVRRVVAYARKVKRLWWLSPRKGVIFRAAG
jgi:hypothetical protein